jgi:hypothetical protein
VADLLLGTAACAGVVSIDAVIRERDMARRRNATTDVPGRIAAIVGWA